jgi:hypothetical protein
LLLRYGKDNFFIFQGAGDRARASTFKASRLNHYEIFVIPDVFIGNPVSLLYGWF